MFFNKLCVRRYYQNCKLLLEFYSSFTYQCRHHFENVKLKTVFKLNLIFSPYVACYFEGNISEKGGQFV